MCTNTSEIPQNYRVLHQKYAQKQVCNVTKEQKKKKTEDFLRLYTETSVYYQKIAKTILHYHKKK